jgi:hypothetical protein
VSKNTIWGNGFDLIEKYKFWNSNVPLITNYKIKDLKNIMLKFMDLHLHKLKVIDVCINFFFCFPRPVSNRQCYTVFFSILSFSCEVEVHVFSFEIKLITMKFLYNSHNPKGTLN